MDVDEIDYLVVAQVRVTPREQAAMSNFDVRVGGRVIVLGERVNCTFAARVPNQMEQYEIRSPDPRLGPDELYGSLDLSVSANNHVQPGRIVANIEFRVGGVVVTQVQNRQVAQGVFFEHRINGVEFPVEVSCRITMHAG